MSELKPCPFCQSGNVEFEERTHWTGMRSVVIAVVIYHWCKDLPNGGRNLIKITGRTKEEAITAWNTRAEGWIPVSERLPEDDKLVMIWDKDWYNLGRYDKYDRGGCWKDLTSYLRSVTHWQPLPAPPK